MRSFKNNRLLKGAIYIVDLIFFFISSSVMNVWNNVCSDIWKKERGEKKDEIIDLRNVFTEKCTISLPERE